MKVNTIIQEIPVVLEDDPIQESERDKVIARLRLSIASRWNHAYDLKPHLPPVDWQRVIDETSVAIKGLIELHGEELPFAPDVMDIIPKESSADAVPMQDQALDDDKRSQSTASGSVQRMCLSHEFRWVDMPRGVWTVLQVGCLDRLNLGIFIIYLGG